NNLVYAANTTGISIGGYDGTVGGTDHCTIVNNTLFQNDTKNTGSGEFQIQYYATNNVFKNNIVYASSQGLFINNWTSSEPNPADFTGSQRRNRPGVDGRRYLGLCWQSARAGKQYRHRRLRTIALPVPKGRFRPRESRGFPLGIFGSFATQK